ncbi:hypothetical protein B0H14DRAFT_2572858 [Mycena olivaceomarginata]|nr:hypothetical protein B0H14DRAFT_2572858 [Mycena olivaceomarginata]
MSGCSSPASSFMYGDSMLGSSDVHRPFPLNTDWMPSSSPATSLSPRSSFSYLQISSFVYVAVLPRQGDVGIIRINEWAQETEMIMAASNFIAHANEFKFRPTAQSSEQFQAAWKHQRGGLSPLPVDSDPSRGTLRRPTKR